MNIRGFLLSNGDTIVGNQVNFVPSAYYTIENAIKISIQRTDNGQVGVSMQPYIPFATSSIELSTSVIVALFEPEQQIENEFNRLYGSGIVVAPAKMILPH
jgi:hypothetical protein